jgi:hypothetical protein
LGCEGFEILVVGGDVINNELILVAGIMLADTHENATPRRVCEGVEHPIQS